MRTVFLVLLALCTVLGPYTAAVITPLSALWYNPISINIDDSTHGEPIEIIYIREVLNDTLISQISTVYSLEDHAYYRICQSDVIGPVEREPFESFPLPLTLFQWMDGDTDCSNLPPGKYHLRTCWTGHQIFLGVVPNKTTCRTSNSFTVRANDAP